MSIFIHTNAQEIKKHGVLFKHTHSLLTNNKILMKLDHMPFEKLFEQVMRLKKNTNELKESFFQFLKLDKGLQPSEDAQKERKGFLFPNIP